MENPKPEALKKIGSDPDVVLGQDMSDFTGNLLKNRGRKLYRTEKGYVGYLGEAYGDGIMDGEALAPGFGVETSFVIG
ncbi:hypothetical protein CDD83_5991 [Cordyceps sp. RAO-2017]|nr:hypothetical protein CDD83_5991 [Cordyceps sp. RAO-2017]